MKKVLSVITALFFSLAVFSAVSAFVRKDTDMLDLMDSQRGSRTVITVNSTWVCEESVWVVDVEGIPTEVYIIDQEAQEEVFHYETVHHKAKTHTENIYRQGTYFLLYIVGTTDEVRVVRKVFADEAACGRYRDRYNATHANQILDIEDTGEVGRYVAGTRTVVDQPAYDEQVKVIDIPAQEEIGHWETVNVGEIGHWENSDPDVTGKGDGYFEGYLRKNKTEVKYNVENQ